VHGRSSAAAYYIARAEAAGKRRPAPVRSSSTLRAAREGAENWGFAAEVPAPSTSLDIGAQKAQTANRMGAVEAAQVANALRAHTFDTVLGRIGFDAAGDVTGYATVVW
jgi:hypothetical protein